MPSTLGNSVDMGAFYEQFRHLRQFLIRLWRRLRPRRSKPNIQVRTAARPATNNGGSRPFTLERRREYLMFGWGTIPSVTSSAVFYFRVRRIGLGESYDRVQARRRESEAIAGRILAIERREDGYKTWQTLLTPPGSHTIRFGYQHTSETGAKTTHHTVDMELNFDRFPPYSGDAIAKAFAGRFLEGLQRNLNMTWYLCPDRRHRYAACIFWLQSAFAIWVEQDLGIERKTWSKGSLRSKGGDR
jgi:hypothetical protein